MKAMSQVLMVHPFKNTTHTYTVQYWLLHTQDYVYMYVCCTLITSRIGLHDGGVDRHSREQHGAVEGELKVALPDSESLSGHLQHLLEVYR